MTRFIEKAEVERLVELLARAKAVWANPKLLNLTNSASSPSRAYRMVLLETGKRKKALAARWYAIAHRDFDHYHAELVDTCVDWLKARNSTLADLKNFLLSALTEQNVSDEQKR